MDYEMSVQKFKGSIPQPQICVVCGDHPSTNIVFRLHYGVICCEACKCFFRRCVQLRKQFTCKLHNICVISDKSHRHMCKSCRFRKCIDAGMKPELVRPRKQINITSFAQSKSANNSDSGGSRSVTPDIRIADTTNFTSPNSSCSSPNHTNDNSPNSPSERLANVSQLVTDDLSFAQDFGDAIQMETTLMPQTHIPPMIPSDLSSLFHTPGIQPQLGTIVQRTDLCPISHQQRPFVMTVRPNNMSSVVYPALTLQDQQRIAHLQQQQQHNQQLSQSSQFSSAYAFNQYTDHYNISTTGLIKSDPTVTSSTTLIPSVPINNVTNSRNLFSIETMPMIKHEINPKSFQIACIEEVLESLRNRIVDLFEWASKCFDFTQLSNTDQKTLLRHSVVELVMIGFARSSISYADMLYFNHIKKVIKRDHSNSSVACVTNLTIEKLVKPLRLLNLTTSEYRNMKEIILFNPESTGNLIKYEHIREFRKKRFQSLFSAANNDVTRFGDILALLAPLFEVATEITEQLRLEQYVVESEAKMDACLLMTIIQGEAINY